MTDEQLIKSILTKYKKKYPRARDIVEYIEYVNDMNRAELEFENTLIPNWTMNRESLEELACGYISDLVDQLVVLQERGDEVNMAIVHAEIKSLSAALDSEDHIFYSTDYRYLD